MTEPSTDLFPCAILSDIIAGVDELACIADWNFAVNNRLQISAQILVQNSQCANRIWVACVIGLFITQLFNTVVNSSHWVRESWALSITGNDQWLEIPRSLNCVRPSPWTTRWEEIILPREKQFCEFTHIVIVPDIVNIKLRVSSVVIMSLLQLLMEGRVQYLTKLAIPVILATDDQDSEIV